MSNVNRRVFLKQGALSFIALGSGPFWGPQFLRQAAWAADLGASATKDKVLVCIFQRGAVDGLSMVVPYGDPNYAPNRPAISLSAPSAPSMPAQKPLRDHPVQHPAAQPAQPAPTVASQSTPAPTPKPPAHRRTRHARPWHAHTHAASALPAPYAIEQLARLTTPPSLRVNPDIAPMTRTAPDSQAQPAARPPEPSTPARDGEDRNRGGHHPARAARRRCRRDPLWPIPSKAEQPDRFTLEALPPGTPEGRRRCHHPGQARH